MKGRSLACFLFVVGLWSPPACTATAADDPWTPLFARLRTAYDEEKTPWAFVEPTKQLERNAAMVADEEVPAAITTISSFATQKWTSRIGKQNGHDRIRTEAVSLLGMLAQRRSDLVVPVFRRLLADPAVGYGVIDEIVKLGPAAKDALPELIAALSGRMRTGAVRAIASMGPAARSAIPSLQKLKVPPDDFDTPLILPDILAKLDGPFLDAWERCDQARSGDVMPGLRPARPALVLAGAQVGPWDYARDQGIREHPDVFAQVPEKGGTASPTLVCVVWSQPRSTTLKYTDGVAAMAYTLDVRVVQFEDGQVAASRSFQAWPASRKTANTPNPVVVPWSEVAGWLGQVLR